MAGYRFSYDEFVRKVDSAILKKPTDKQTSIRSDFNKVKNAWTQKHIPNMRSSAKTLGKHFSDNTDIDIRDDINHLSKLKQFPSERNERGLPSTAGKSPVPESPSSMPVKQTGRTKRPPRTSSTSGRSPKTSPNPDCNDEMKERVELLESLIHNLQKDTRDGSFKKPDWKNADKRLKKPDGMYDPLQDIMGFIERLSSELEDTKEQLESVAPSIGKLYKKLKPSTPPGSGKPKGKGQAAKGQKAVGAGRSDGAPSLAAMVQVIEESVVRKSESMEASVKEIKEELDALTSAVDKLHDDLEPQKTPSAGKGKNNKDKQSKEQPGKGTDQIVEGKIGRIRQRIKQKDDSMEAKVKKFKEELDALTSAVDELHDELETQKPPSAGKGKKEKDKQSKEPSGKGTDQTGETKIGRIWHWIKQKDDSMEATVKGIQEEYDALMSAVDELHDELEPQKPPSVGKVKHDKDKQPKEPSGKGTDQTGEGKIGQIRQWIKQKDDSMEATVKGIQEEYDALMSAVDELHDELEPQKPPSVGKVKHDKDKQPKEPSGKGTDQTGEGKIGQIRQWIKQKDDSLQAMIENEKGKMTSVSTRVKEVLESTDIAAKSEPKRSSSGASNTGEVAVENVLEDLNQLEQRLRLSKLAKECISDLIRDIQRKQIISPLSGGKDKSKQPTKGTRTTEDETSTDPDVAALRKEVCMWILELYSCVEKAEEKGAWMWNEVLALQSEVKRGTYNVERYSKPTPEVADEGEDMSDVKSVLTTMRLKLQDNANNWKRAMNQQELLKKRAREMNAQFERELVDKEAERKDLMLRNSKIARAKMTHENPNIADLSDANRLTKLAEKFSELYDNQWTDTLCRLKDNCDMEELESVAELFRVVTEAYRYCTVTAEVQMRQIESAFQQPEVTVNQAQKNVPSINLEPVQRKALHDIRKQTAETAIAHVREGFLHSLRLSEDKRKALGEFVDASVELCWYMVIQSPPVVMDTEDRAGQKFDKDRFRAYMKSGKTIAYMVWPVLYIDEKKKGVLSKGVVQPK